MINSVSPSTLIKSLDLNPEVSLTLINVETPVAPASRISSRSSVDLDLTLASLTPLIAFAVIVETPEIKTSSRSSML